VIEGRLEEALMNRTTLAMLLAVILPAAAAADDRGPRHEEGQDRAALQDDLRDAERAQALLDDFDRAAAARNAISLAFIEGHTMDALRAELAEASRETAQSGREAQRSEGKDRHDFIEKAEYRRRIQGLTDEWSRLKGLRRPAAMKRKHDILVELVRLSHFEIRSDAGEDRGGRRDDRHDGRREHR
jgi:hypothetical protein